MCFHDFAEICEALRLSATTERPGISTCTATTVSYSCCHLLVIAVTRSSAVEPSRLNGSPQAKRVTQGRHREVNPAPVPLCNRVANARTGYGRCPPAWPHSSGIRRPSPTQWLEKRAGLAAARIRNTAHRRHRRYPLTQKCGTKLQTTRHSSYRSPFTENAVQ
jgi:hypothetical protein